MKKNSTSIFLQIVIVFIGIAALGLLLWEPHLEGVNANATFFEVYLDPFIALVYLGSLPFFAGLYHAFKVVGYAGERKLLSPESVKALATIKYCAVTIIGFVIVEEIFILANHGNDDVAGGVAMGILIAFSSLMVAAVAKKFETSIRNTMTARA